MRKNGQIRKHQAIEQAAWEREAQKGAKGGAAGGASAGEVRRQAAVCDKSDWVSLCASDCAMRGGLDYT